MRSESKKEIEESNASKGKKRKVDFENRGFNKYWEDKYSHGQKKVTPPKSDDFTMLFHE